MAARTFLALSVAHLAPISATAEYMLAIKGEVVLSREFSST